MCGLQSPCLLRVVHLPILPGLHILLQLALKNKPRSSPSRSFGLYGLMAPGSTCPGALKEKKEAQVRLMEDVWLTGDIFLTR